MIAWDVYEKQQELEKAGHKWIEEHVMPVLREKFQQLKKRNLRDGIKFVCSNNQVHFSGAGDLDVDNDRLYNFWIHNEDYLCQRWPEMKEFLELVDAVYNDFRYEVGDFE